MTRRPLRSTLFPYTTLFRSFSSFLTDWWVVFAAIFVVGLIVVIGGLRTQRGKDIRDRLALKVPVLGDLIDRKSTRLNSSHVEISYAVFCLKKKKTAVNAIVR